MFQKKAKTLISKTLKNSSAFIVGKFLHSEHLLNKLIWIAFLIFTVSVSSFYLFIAFKSFFDYKVVTLIEKTSEQPSQFPTITFCNNNKYYFDSKNLTDFIYNITFGYSVFNGSTLGNYLEGYYSKRYGQCYRFNSGKNLRNYSVPILSLTIGGSDDSFNMYFDSPGGIFIWIHNYTSPIKLVQYNNHYGNRILFSNKVYGQIVIEKIMEKKLGLPYNECYENVSDSKANKTLIDHIRSQGEAYSQRKCLELCFDLVYISNNTCKCTNFTLGNVWERCWIILENSSKTSCMWDFKKAFFTNSIQNQCAKYCPLECSTISYLTQSSSLSYEERNISRLKVFYPDLQNTLIRQEEKIMLYDLISDIGGILGLFIGISIMNLFEIFELVAELMFVLVYFIKKNRL